ncbi:F-box domain-containing protein [Phlyctema vagabunda]|uniref:F-box domain-containing protein n=1 Tax=Phlyctema vagabunda TaxID=108571 RepID=A0ABR4PS58_9HELO
MSTHPTTSNEGPSPCAFESLPDEVIQQILYYVPPFDTLHSVQRTSRRLLRASNEPLLWRYHCRFGFRYWDSKHRITQKLRGPVGNVDWKLLFLHRQRVAHRTDGLLDSILQDQIGRIAKFQEIAEFGYDAKDVLLQHCGTDESADDVLARRFYSTAVLDHLHRSEALAEWGQLQKGTKIPLERALACFDLFILHDQRGDLVEITDMLDQLVVDLGKEISNLDELSTRDKAIAVVTFLRAHNLTGIASDLSYHNLQNNYIGVALQHAEHASLPLISAAIFCAVAQRIGVDAHCAEIPTHIHVIVYPNVDEDLDGKRIPQEQSADPMYLDPFRTDSEIPVQNLKSFLASWGVMPEQFHHFLKHSDPVKLILRVSRNIVTAVSDFTRQQANNPGHSQIQLYGNPFIDLENAYYSAIWANFMFGNSITQLDGQQQPVLAVILERFERGYPMDVSLVERYICTPFDGRANGQLAQLYETLRVIRQGDVMPKPVHSRNNAGCCDIQYRVGQVFRHKRYGYTAVITGWDKECGMNSDWRVHNQVQNLTRGENQNFYHALVEDTSIRYVAAENVEIIKPVMPTALMSFAGQYFKRWDSQNHVFVSNIRDEYPED